MFSTRKNPLNRRGSAILDLAVGCSYNSEADGTIIKWLTPDIPQPSEADIEAKIAEYKIEWDAQEYSHNRQAEYPDWGTQLNKIYDDGIDAWKTDMVDPIKAKFPKP